MRTPLFHLAVIGLAAPGWSPCLGDSGSRPIGAPDSDIVLVSQGCGPLCWRGPWGHCRDTPNTGRMPGGGWAYNRPPTAALWLFEEEQ